MVAPAVADIAYAGLAWAWVMGAHIRDSMALLVVGCSEESELAQLQEACAVSKDSTDHKRPVGQVVHFRKSIVGAKLAC